jgi:hypothetical protein
MRILAPRECAKPRIKGGGFSHKANISEWRAPATGLKEWTEHVTKRAYAVSAREQASQLAKLDSFRELQRGWDSYGAEPPSDAAINNARRILRVLWEYEGGSQIRLSPSVEGGVGIIFSSIGKKYADIECFNDGDILAVMSEGTPEPLVWTVDSSEESFRSAIDKIIAFLNG